MKINPLSCIDFYKADHRRQYPEGTNRVYSNFTPRSSKLAKVLPDFDDRVVFFGLQGWIKWFLMDTWNREFFDKPKDVVVRQYKRRMDNSLGPGAIDVKHIEELHDLGYLPIEIKAVKEGSRVNMRVPVLTIENTDDRFFWLTNYLESVMSAELWKPCTTATTAYEYRRLLFEYARKTGSPEEFVDFQGHDFSFRGLSGVHDAHSSSAGHLLSFVGTDTVPAIDYLEEYYLANSDKELVGTSVPATEHSVMCMGTQEDEIGTFRRLITDLYPKGVVSIVSDTWDFWKVITEYALELKDEILSREINELGLAKVVFRPDSGDPVKIICGEDIEFVEEEYEGSLEAIAIDILSDIAIENQEHGQPGMHTVEKLIECNGKYYRISGQPLWNRHDKQYYYYDGMTDIKVEEVELTPAEKGAVRCLWEIFGGSETATGHKVLNERVGLIYGDSITLERCQAILEGLERNGFASCNLVFGIGSFTYQYCTRDNFGFAMKATYGEVNGVGREIFKDPVTDSGSKKSAKGRLKVMIDEDGNYILEEMAKDNLGCHLEQVFRNGVLVRNQSLEEIRANLRENSQVLVDSSR